MTLSPDALSPDAPSPDAPSPDASASDTPRRARTLLTIAPRPPAGDREWALTLVPAFPLLLLVLRVWFLARQDLQTVLLVLQSANTLGLVASLLISMVWAVPALLLVLRALYLLQLVSEVQSRSWLARVEVRTPVWVSVPAAGLAALSWQLRFLPALLLLVLLIAGLEVRHRVRASLPVGPVWAAVSVLVVLPAALWLIPAAYRAATEHDDLVTAALIVVPLLLAPLLPGPIPPRVARWLLPGLATVVVIAVPIVLGQRYLDAPVLPRVAVRYVDGAATTGGAERVQRGSLVSVDDRFVTVLDSGGRVHFIDNTRVRSQVLCSTGPEPPTTDAEANGWQVEQSVLSWAAPHPAERVSNIDCRGG